MMAVRHDSVRSRAVTPGRAGPLRASGGALQGRPCGGGEGGEQALLRLGEDEQLRVPLDADQEWLADALDGLHDAGLVAGHDAQAAPNPVHRLVVQGVDPARVAAGDAVET